MDTTTLKNIFSIEKEPRRGLLNLEWVVVAYIAFTLLIILFTYTKVANPDAMVWGRMRVLAIIAAMWAVYRLVPCRFTMMLRVVIQMSLLARWYPDTYELNRLFPNLDHHFAAFEHSIFGFQPALAFYHAFPQHAISELMDLGYASYYPMIALVCFFYFFRRYDEFLRCSFIVLTSFFLYYVVYDLLPVVGPTFYFKAIGLEQASKGVFPALGSYFNTHQECMPSPGWHEGICYNLVEVAKEAGERPTAAFPSSHVGVATICMFLAARTRNRSLLWLLMPFYVLLCLSTVYIQAHYALDAIAGLATGIAIYFALAYATRRKKK